MPKALIIYTTRTGKTREIADSIAEGLRAAGAEVKTIDAKNVKNEADLAGYDAYVFGSPTYHGEMMQAMKTMLFLAERANLSGKVGGAFGSYGWSGEAPERIYNTMKNIFNMDMASTALRVKSPAPAGVMQQVAQAYGRDVGQRIKA